MKIINREEFLKLPSGTLFSEYKPCSFYGLLIKYDSCGYNDYYENELIGNIEMNSSEDFIDKLVIAEKERTSLKLDFDICGRNGMYDDNQLYAVYEKEDIKGLINVLKQCIPYE